MSSCRVEISYAEYIYRLLERGEDYSILTEQEYYEMLEVMKE